MIECAYEIMLLLFRSAVSDVFQFEFERDEQCVEDPESKLLTHVLGDEDPVFGVLMDASCRLLLQDVIKYGVRLDEYLGLSAISE